MARVTYTVKAGDTLSEIAVKYNTTVSKLASLNNIKNVDLIYVGQTLLISKDNSSDSTPETVPTNTVSTITIVHFGLQSDTDRTVFATWEWSKDNTKHYEVMWQYYADGYWFVGQDGTSDYKESIYNAPTNAEQVRFKAKPVSETKTVNKKETSYWTASWSTYQTYSFSANPPVAPAAPSVEIRDFTLTARLENLDVNGTHIQFQVVQDDTKVFATGKAQIITNSASYACTVSAGSEYKVRCRSVRGSEYSDWSEYSSNVNTKPAASDGITVCRTSSESSIYLEWKAVSNADAYDIEYATKKTYFDGSDQTTTVSGIEYTHYTISGMESGEEYFFRVRATNDQGESAWSSIKSVVLGKTPAAPTTWSSTTTGITGEPVILYWIHNSEDGSTQRSARVEVTIAGSTTTHTIDTSSEADDEKTMFYRIETSSYTEGTKIEWRVQTAGVTGTYSEWSIQRTVDIYSPPSLSLVITGASNTPIDTLTSFPLKITGNAGPNTQSPVGYHLTITANEGYETVDNIGNRKVVGAGEEVYSRYYDISSQLQVILSASDVTLENNVSYTTKVVVSMNSGLTAESSALFDVAWTDAQYEPIAEIIVDSETLVAHIRPFCVNENGVMIDDVILSVYRREFDGSYTEIATGLSNTNNTYVTDPHPALDYARYRIVALTDSTGAVSYYDMPDEPVGETGIVLQWNDDWDNLVSEAEDELVENPWTGSMLKLPYNVDVSDDHSPDMTLVNYIGRENPVSYYGTHIGHTATWNSEIPAYDYETLYGLRRLARWMGDVYVREPSGSGYWAHVVVSFNQKHLALTIPVTLRITRVDGGI